MSCRVCEWGLRDRERKKKKNGDGDGDDDERALANSYTCGLSKALIYVYVVSTI